VTDIVEQSRPGHKVPQGVPPDAFRRRTTAQRKEVGGGYSAGGAHRGLAVALQQIHEPSGNVRGAHGVTQSGVGATAVHQVREPQLLDSPQALEAGRVNQRRGQGVVAEVAMDRVPVDQFTHDAMAPVWNELQAARPAILMPPASPRLFRNRS
jgi:hypothetical protein